MLMQPNPHAGVIELARFVREHMMREQEMGFPPVEARRAELRIVRDLVDLAVVKKHGAAGTLEEITCFDTGDGPFEFAGAFARALEAFVAAQAEAAQVHLS
jgi:hypothetical protein